MGRLAWYAGVSTVLAGGVIISAFNQRANFYSACIYLAQSNLCLMILINLILLVYGTFVYSLQRLCYGPLRPIEIEQLYEKGWFAVTETCLAMTIFREEVGAWFLVMFVALLTGKVWGWIGDGRVEILDQQPPANPKLFHIRISISLAMSIIYDLMVMNYIIGTVIQQARPNMMVMFLFEFAILTTSSLATSCRYAISLVEAKVVKTQTKQRLLERRREVREERAELIRQREAAAASNIERNIAEEPSAPLPSEEDVDEMDIEVPGWEAKGQWILTLDLLTDFLKLAIYTTFFFVLLMFYGIPIHIVRDLFMTARSFMKRLAAFLRYRRATRNMNARYPDATAEDIQREDTCIICREDMRPWAVTNPQAPPAAPGAIPPTGRTASVNERTRPKKLPCGHILHLGCLKSWLERQQVCPTCRRPVVDLQAQATTAAQNAAPGQGQPPQIAGQQDVGGGQPQAAGREPRRGMRMLNLGPLRVGFGQANFHDLARGLGVPQAGPENARAGGPRVYGLELGFPRPQAHQGPGVSHRGPGPTLQEQLQDTEAQILTELNALQITQQEYQLISLLRVELDRIRATRNGVVDPIVGNIQMPRIPPLGQLPGGVSTPFTQTLPFMQPFRPAIASALTSGHPDLPPGVAIPEGWTLLPLQRFQNTAGAAQNDVSSAVPVPTATAQPDPNPSSGGNQNNTQAPNPTEIFSGPSMSTGIDTDMSRASSSRSPILKNPEALSSLESVGVSEEAQLNKGKGKAATVEDINDECDG